MALTTRLKSAFAALAGNPPPVAPAPQVPPEPCPQPAPPPAPPPGPNPDEARIAALRLDLDERDRRIEALLKEADEARDTSRGDAESVAADRMNKLLRRLAPLLAQADAMRHFETEGKPLRAEDAFALMAKIEKSLAEEGVERIGEAGADTAFDQSLHQRLSGGDVRHGDPVRVRFVGFRQSGKILSKALVSRKEDDDAPRD